MKILGVIKSISENNYDSIKDNISKLIDKFFSNNIVVNNDPKVYLPDLSNENNSAENYFSILTNTRKNLIKSIYLDQSLQTYNDTESIEENVDKEYYFNIEGIKSIPVKNIKNIIIGSLSNKAKYVTSESDIENKIKISKSTPIINSFINIKMPNIDNAIDNSNACTIHVSPRRNNQIKYLVFHYTAGSTSKPGSAKNTCKVFHERQASADFIVDDASMIQYNADPEKFYTWAVGDKGSKNKGGTFRGICYNRNSISIEMCSNLRKGADWKTPNHNGWYFTPETISNALKLGKILMKKYNISINNVLRHYDVTGKLCPGIPGWNLEHGSNDESQWLWFKQQLTSI